MAAQPGRQRAGHRPEHRQGPAGPPRSAQYQEECTLARGPSVAPLPRSTTSRMPSLRTAARTSYTHVTTQPTGSDARYRCSAGPGGSGQLAALPTVAAAGRRPWGVLGLGQQPGDSLPGPIQGDVSVQGAHGPVLRVAVGCFPNSDRPAGRNSSQEHRQGPAAPPSAPQHPSRPHANPANIHWMADRSPACNDTGPWSAPKRAASTPCSRMSPNLMTVDRRVPPYPRRPLSKGQSGAPPSVKPQVSELGTESQTDYSVAS